MFAPFSTFPLPDVRPQPEGDHLMDWVGWRGNGFIALTPVDGTMTQTPELQEENELLLFRPRPVRKKRRN